MNLPGRFPDQPRAIASTQTVIARMSGALAERGATPLQLADMTSLVHGVVGVRLAADVVLDLWQRHDGGGGADRSAARLELLASTTTVVGWFDRLAAALAGHGEPPEALAPDEMADSRWSRCSAVTWAARTAPREPRRRGWSGPGDFLDAMRRLQRSLVSAGLPAPARGLAAYVS